MSNPVSQPVIPPQPNQQYYGVSALALFQTFTRETYLSAFGIQAPSYDPTRVIKTWFDSTVDTSNPSNVALYNIVGQDQSGNWRVQQMVMPAQQAATVICRARSPIRPMSSPLRKPRAAAPASIPCI